jgi:hypothetical protein
VLIELVCAQIDGAMRDARIALEVVPRQIGSRVETGTPARRVVGEVIIPVGLIHEKRILVKAAGVSSIDVVLDVAVGQFQAVARIMNLLVRR